jgi:hypothetical protein
LSKINDIEIDNLLLQNSKVKPTWNNLISNYTSAGKELSEYAVAFLNKIENAALLSKHQMEKEPDEDVIKKLSRAVLLNETINNDSYALLLKSIPYYYTSLNFENMSKEKTKLMIENGKLGLNQENYNKLRENFVGLHIALIEKRKIELSANIDKLDFDDNDIIVLLKSPVLSFKEKETILTCYGDTDIISSSDILDLIGRILLNHNTFNISYDVKKAILTKSKLKIDDKLLLFNNINSIFDKKEITAILQSFPKPYSNIAENGKRPNLSQNAVNTDFAKTLKEKKYICDFKADKKGIRISTFRK